MDRVACKIAWLFRISLSRNPPGPFSPFSRPLSYLGHSRARRTSHSPALGLPPCSAEGRSSQVSGQGPNSSFPCSSVKLAYLVFLPLADGK